MSYRYQSLYFLCLLTAKLLGNPTDFLPRAVLWPVCNKLLWAVSGADNPEISSPFGTDTGTSLVTGMSSLQPGYTCN